MFPRVKVDVPADGGDHCDACDGERDPKSDPGDLFHSLFLLWEKRTAASDPAGRNGRREYPKPARLLRGAKKGAATAARPPNPLDVKAEEDDVAVLHDLSLIHISSSASG